MFLRRFREVKISPSKFRRIHLKHKINFKNIKRGKNEIVFTDSYYISLFHRIRALIKQMEESQTQVIYLDETVFIFSNFGSQGWANRRERIKVGDSKVKVQILALICDYKLGWRPHRLLGSSQSLQYRSICPIRAAPLRETRRR